MGMAMLLITITDRGSRLKLVAMDAILKRSYSYDRAEHPLLESTLMLEVD